MNGLQVAGIVCVVVGVAGTALPVLPGVPLVLVGLVLVAWADQFVHVGPWTFALLGVLTLAGIAVDFLATLLGARRVGASRPALIGAAAGSVLGLFFGLPGLLLGPFLGALLGELVVHGDLLRSGKVGLGTWLGLLVGSVLKLLIVLLMIAIFVIAHFWVE